TLTDVPVNSYIVTASKSGYFSLSSDNVVVTKNDTSTVDFQLTWISDLVGFWAFEETSGTTAYDSSGNKNDGVVYGPVSTPDGRIGLAYQFDGSYDYITVPRSVSLDGITEAITLIAWVRLPDRYRHTILSRWVYGDGTERSFEFDIEKGKVWFGLSGNGSGGTFLNSANAITPDEWSHVAATSDGSIMKIYFNGVLDPMTEVPPSSIHTSSADLQIGRWMTGPDQWFYPFDGTMDEVKIYNRALTAQEIEDDYNLAPVGIHENPVSLPLDRFFQAYPNPFIYSTTIGYKTAVTGRVTISIYNLSGQKIGTLVNETRQAGHHSVVWDGTNATGGFAGSGMYFCILHIDNRPVATKKLVLLK
ncbi:MAG: LamG-like jellyroll fold domain-containing protein, partial [Bacteroidota bacterium]|nr:LamG-like jellyroll fold domain-containing protein [Bacteroidota bacterium]